MRKDYVNLWVGSSIMLKLFLCLYSDLDAMDEGKFFARIPSILKESAEGS
jgi:hypothetical protein